VSATRIKICGIREAAHAALAADAGADAIGLVFYRRQRRATSTAERASHRERRCRPTSMPSGSSWTSRRVDPAILRRSPRHAAVPGRRAPQFCDSFGRPYVRAVRMETGGRLVEYRRRFRVRRNCSSMRTCPGSGGGTGQVFDWAGAPVEASGAAHSFRRPHGRERGGRDPQSAAVGRGCVERGRIEPRGEGSREDRRIHSERAT
jgi:phosphoribosylanthranilate isomerase